MLRRIKQSSEVDRIYKDIQDSSRSLLNYWIAKETETDIKKLKL